jgi:hypothetical protein
MIGDTGNNMKKGSNPYVCGGRATGGTHGQNLVAGRPKKGANPNVCGARLIAFERCRSFFGGGRKH